MFSANNSQIKKCSDEIKNLFDENKIYFKNNKKGIYITPLREKDFEQKDIWSIPNLIKSFLKLKSDLIGYKNSYFQLKKEKLKDKLIEEEGKQLIFRPEINKKNFVFKNEKYDYYNNKEDDLNKTYTNATHTRKNDFDKLYERFMDDKNKRESILEILRERKKQKQEKQCTLIPKIIKYRPRKSDLKKRLNKSVDISSNLKIEDNDINKKVPVYERLYSFRKIYNQKKIQLEENKKLGNKYNTKLSVKENRSKNKKNIKPKLYAIQKKDLNANNKNMDNANTFNNKLKNINNNKVYEKKIQKMKMKHFNISKEMDNNNIIDDIYVIMDINTPKGGKKPIKIYKNQENINELVDNFCKKNNINDKDRKTIYNQALLYQNNIFGRNTVETNFEDK